MENLKNEINNTNSWHVYSKLILHQIEQQDKDIEKLKELHHKNKNEIAVLKVKAIMFSGVLALAISIAVRFIK